MADGQSFGHGFVKERVEFQTHATMIVDGYQDAIYLQKGLKAKILQDKKAHVNTINDFFLYINN